MEYVLLHWFDYFLLDDHAFLEWQQHVIHLDSVFLFSYVQVLQEYHHLSFLHQDKQFLNFFRLICWWWFLIIKWCATKFIIRNIRFAKHFIKRFIQKFIILINFILNILTNSRWLCWWWNYKFVIKLNMFKKFWFFKKSFSTGGILYIGFVGIDTGDDISCWIGWIYYYVLTHIEVYIVKKEMEVVVD